jgi:hypothetical protein
MPYCNDPLLNDVLRLDREIQQSGDIGGYCGQDAKCWRGRAVTQYLFVVLCLITSLTAYAFTLRSDSPSKYVVQNGDSLWDIASRYLEHPWEWPLLWHANPQIHNPNHLYPGAVIALHYNQQQQPYLRVLSNGTVKWSPSMHIDVEKDVIPPIPLSDIRPFLDASLVLDHDALINAPYVIAFTAEHMLGGQGDEVYVKNICPQCQLNGLAISYGIYRPNGEYYSPYTKTLLGYKASLIGYAELLRSGDPATIVLTDIMQAVKLMDRVMLNNHPGFDLDFIPKSPAKPFKGTIIDLPGGYSRGAEGLVVVLDHGKDCGLQAGDVLAVYTNPKRIKDLECPYGCVRIPRERVGEVMVFRTFTHTSFALVMRATRAIEVMDKVSSP